MSGHIEKSIDLATKITTKAEDALADLDLEMAIMKWPAEFRAIMWETVAAIATQRGKLARGIDPPAERGPVQVVGGE